MRQQSHFRVLSLRDCRRKIGGIATYFLRWTLRRAHQRVNPHE